MMSNHSLNMQSIEGGRASYAYEQVRKVSQSMRNKEEFKLYTSYLQRLPGMIKVNGLGQAIAFYISKYSGSNHESITQAISDWVLAKPELELGGNKPFMEIIVSLNSDKYRRVTAEVLALLKWMIRFATGITTEMKAKQGPADNGEVSS